MFGGETRPSAPTRHKNNLTHTLMQQPLGKIEQTGSCLCGAIKFKASGNIQGNVLCHCRTCSRAKGMSPVQLIIVTKGGDADIITFTQGEDKLQVAKGYGDMEHLFCSECGCGICQGLHAFSSYFRAVFPSTFQIEDGASCLVPEIYRPRCHVHYENRLFDWNDDLPKWKGGPPGDGMPGEKVQVSNSGAVIVTHVS